jgi:hypothetical protein
MTNGQVERANGMILQGLKPRIYNDLNKFGKRWIKELPSVVWSLRTTLSRCWGEGKDATLRSRPPPQSLV